LHSNGLYRENARARAAEKFFRRCAPKLLRRSGDLNRVFGYFAARTFAKSKRLKGFRASAR
jgi:hypothetical protein